MKKHLLPTASAVATLFMHMLLAMLLLPATAFADSDTEVTVNKIAFTLDAATKTATVTSYNGTSQTVNIPGTVTSGNDTYNVTAIGFKAFSGSSVTSVTMNKNLLTIGKNAF